MTDSTPVRPGEWQVFELPGDAWVAVAADGDEAYVADTPKEAVAGLEALRERLAAKRLVTVEIDLDEDLVAATERRAGGPAGSWPWNAYIAWSIARQEHRRHTAQEHEYDC